MHTSTLGLLHRPEVRWRRRHVFGVLRLRPAIGQHSLAEAALLMRYAKGAEVVVELGVAEGGSAAELRTVMAPTGELYLVDPYEPRTCGVSMARIVARRTVNKVRRGQVRWVRQRSAEAGRDWHGDIDFLFIDAEHSYERAESDWRTWSSHVGSDGRVALHDSVVFAGGWTTEGSGPVRLLRDILRNELQWELLAQADSLSVLGRKGATAHGSA